MFNTDVPWNLVADGYAATTSNLFESYAKAAIDLTHIDLHSHVLDVACGPGTLPLLIYQKCHSIKAIDFAERMVAIFTNTIEQSGITNIEVTCADAQHLPYQDEVFDAAFSMFGLMFFPDRGRGYAEIYRTLKPGGEVVISSWAPVADSPAMQLMFGAVRKLNPDIPSPQTVIDSLENNEYFKGELVAAGFKDVAIHRVTQAFNIESIDKMWKDLVMGSAPIAMLKKNLPPPVWNEREAAALEFLANSLPTLPTSLSSDAWLGYGVK